MTEPTVAAVPDPTPEPAKERERSTIRFPYYSLSDAIALAQTVHGLGDRCGQDQLVTPLGYSSVENGAFSLRLAAARHFGLIDYSKDGVTLSALGHRIVDPTQEARARAEAFLIVPLYKRLYDDYKGRSLPNTNIGLEAVLVSYGVAAKQKDKARQILQRSADQAGFFYQGKDRLVLPAISNQIDAPHTGQTPPKGEAEIGGGGGGSNGGRGSDGGGGSRLPTLIQGLIEKLPPEGAVWSDTEQTQWVNAAKMIFGLIYKTERIALPSGSHADNGHSGALSGQSETVGA